MKIYKGLEVSDEEYEELVQQEYLNYRRIGPTLEWVLVNGEYIPLNEESAKINPNEWFKCLLSKK